MRRFGTLQACTAVVAWTLTVSVGAQRNSRIPPPSPSVPQQGVPQAPVPGMTPLGEDDSMAERTSHIQHEQEKARNDERQKKLIADTDKLLALATELKANVDKSDKNTMSVDVIRKAEEIEKLARSVKEKMKGS